MVSTVSRKTFGELAEHILEGGAYKATKYLSEKLTVKATLVRYKKGVVHGAKNILFTIGKPNYEEREAIKRNKRTGLPPLDIILKYQKA